MLLAVLLLLGVSTVLLLLGVSLLLEATVLLLLGVSTELLLLGEAGVLLVLAMGLAAEATEGATAETTEVTNDTVGHKSTESHAGLELATESTGVESILKGSATKVEVGKGGSNGASLSFRGSLISFTFNLFSVIDNDVTLNLVPFSDLNANMSDITDNIGNALNVCNLVTDLEIAGDISNSKIKISSNIFDFLTESEVSVVTVGVVVIEAVIIGNFGNSLELSSLDAIAFTMELVGKASITISVLLLSNVSDGVTTERGSRVATEWAAGVGGSGWGDWGVCTLVVGVMRTVSVSTVRGVRGRRAVGSGRMGGMLRGRRAVGSGRTGGMLRGGGSVGGGGTGWVLGAGRSGGSVGGASTLGMRRSGRLLGSVGRGGTGWVVGAGRSGGSVGGTSTLGMRRS